MLLDRCDSVGYENLTPFEQAEVNLVMMAAKIKLTITMQQIVEDLKPENYEKLTPEQKQQIDDDLVTIATAFESVGISA